MDEAKTSIGLNLREIELKSEYNTEDDDIVRDLYRPCFAASKRYSRAVGYFRANIYRELGVTSGGRVRIVCSPNIPEPDEDAAREGYALRGKRSNQEKEASLVHVLNAMSEDPDESDCLSMLRLLVECELLELYVAVRPGGIYHRKIGVFRDHADNIVAFSGSGNETRSAVGGIEDWGNDEEFDVYRSWGDDFESSKALKKSEYLERLFGGGTKHTRVRPLNDVEREVLARFRSHADLESCRQGARLRRPAKEDLATKEWAFKPRYYQTQAIEAWNSAGRVGMLSMATATGKTFTALFAISPLVKAGRPIVILVPTKVLLSQWYKEIRRFYPGVPILLAGGGYNWKADNKKRVFVSKTRRPRIILSTMATASSDDFLEFLGQAESPVLIADEAHRIGSPGNRRILESILFEERLGLSATPERLFDSEGQEALEKAFGTNPVYNLPIGARVKVLEDDPTEAPIIGRFLSKYDYYFEVVRLTPDEQQEWDRRTLEIRRFYAKNRKSLEHDNWNDAIGGKLQHLLIQRARILKRAREKVDCACKVVAERYPKNGRWIVYCEDGEQLRSVTDAVRINNRRTPVLTYYSGMNPTDRDRTLQYFEQQPCIIVSIRCLDEGVDIPNIDGALILASSKNPREYIQRRGRVLRKSIGKRKATIVDAIVLPSKGTEKGENVMPIVKGELARAWGFAKFANNKEVSHELWRIATEYGVDVSSDALVSVQNNKEVSM
jgi:superfamily II DNA or RNA helicase